MAMLKVHVEFLDGRTPEDHETPINYNPGQEKQACMQLLIAINSAGGVVDFNPDGTIEMLPITTVKKLTIAAPSIIVPPSGIVVP